MGEFVAYAQITPSEYYTLTAIEREAIINALNVKNRRK